MDFITDSIAIGNFIDASNVENLRENGIRSIVSLDGKLLTEHAIHLGVAEIASYHLIDGAGNDLRRFRSAIDSLGRLLLTQSPVLVHCHAGRSRSVAVVAGYLMGIHQFGARDAIAMIHAKRETNVSRELVALLERL